MEREDTYKSCIRFSRIIDPHKNKFRSITSIIFYTKAVDSNLHSPERRLIDLRIEHGDLDAMIDRASGEVPLDELLMRRLKKKRLSLRDEIARIERQLNPDEPA